MSKKKKKSKKEPQKEKEQDPIVEAAFSGPAFLSNRTAISIVGAGVRIAFLEQHDPEKPLEFRTAAILGISDAISMRKLLEKMLKDFEKQIENFENSEKKKEEDVE